MSTESLKIGKAIRQSSHETLPSLIDFDAIYNIIQKHTKNRDNIDFLKFSHELNEVLPSYFSGLTHNVLNTTLDEEVQESCVICHRNEHVNRYNTIGKNKSAGNICKLCYYLSCIINHLEVKTIHKFGDIISFAPVQRSLKVQLLSGAVDWFEYFYKPKPFQITINFTDEPID